MLKFIKNKITNLKLPVILVFITVISINLYFGAPRIEKFSAIDETLWSYGRVPKFWKSIKKGNLRGTRPCDKPGVTLAMISGIGLPFVDNPEKYEDLRYQKKTPEQLSMINRIYFFLRLPIYIFTLFSLPFFYFFIKKLWNEKIALLSMIFIGLSPILLGISLIINADAILWILMPFSLLSFLIYQKENDSLISQAKENKESEHLSEKNIIWLNWWKNKKFLYLSGFFLGMAILNKFVANLLFPFFLAFIFLRYILNNYSKEEAPTYFKKSIKDYLIFILTTFLTIFVFYPKTWIDPASLFSVTIFSMAFEKIWPFFVGSLVIILVDIFWFKSFFIKKICTPFKNFKSLFIKTISFGTLSLIIFVFLNVLQKMKYYNFENIFFWPKPDLFFLEEFKDTFFSAFFPLIYGIPPLICLFFILTIIFLISIKQVEKKQNLISAFILLFFILVFYFANSIAQISSTVRYQIVIYPIASIIAAVGLYEVINFKIIKKYFSGIKFYILTVIIILISFLSLKNINPFFLSYSSELLPKKYIINPRDMADGSWEASEYLNNLLNATNLVIWSDKKQVCEKFIGKCSTDVNKNIHYNYFITSRSSKSKVFKKSYKKEIKKYKIGTSLINVPKLYSEEDSGDFKIIIGGRNKNYVKITNAELAK